MRSKLTTLLTVIGAVTVLVLAANTVAMATTGKAILAGKINTASKMTSITRTTPGTGLQVKTKSGANAPFAVNGKGKVVNLNADTLDGLDSSGLRANAYVWTKSVPNPNNFFSVIVPLPAGTYVLGYGVQMVGGGTTDGAAWCYFFKEPAVGANTFYAESRTLTKAGVTPALSGTGLVQVAAGDKVRFYCLAPTNFVTAANHPVQITATRANVVGGGAL